MAYNIIFYFSDQQRWDTCGCFGQPLNITPNLDKLAAEGVKFDNAFSPQPVCGPCRALFQTGKYPTETGCFRNNLMLPSNIKTLGEYMEKDAGYETAYVGKWHLASDGELEKKPTIDHTITAVPLELRGGYTGYWRAADVLEFTSHGYDGYVFDENNNRIDFKGYRADCINQFALDYLDQYTGEKPFFMTVSQTRAAPPERPQPLRRSHRFPAAICKLCSAGGSEGSGRQRSGRIPGLSGSVRQPRREPRQAGGEAEEKRLI